MTNAEILILLVLLVDVVGYISLQSQIDRAKDEIVTKIFDREDEE